MKKLISARCRESSRICCGDETEAAPNRLLCGQCGDWRTNLIGGH